MGLKGSEGYGKKANWVQQNDAAGELANIGARSAASDCSVQGGTGQHKPLHLHFPQPRPPLGQGLAASCHASLALFPT